MKSLSILLIILRVLTHNAESSPISTKRSYDAARTNYADALWATILGAGMTSLLAVGAFALQGLCHIWIGTRLIDRTFERLTRFEKEKYALNSGRDILIDGVKREKTRKENTGEVIYLKW